MFVFYTTLYLASYLVNPVLQWLYFQIPNKSNCSHAHGTIIRLCLVYDCPAMTSTLLLASLYIHNSLFTKNVIKKTL